MLTLRCLQTLTLSHTQPYACTLPPNGQDAGKSCLYPSTGMHDRACSTELSHQGGFLCAGSALKYSHTALLAVHHARLALHRAREALLVRQALQDLPHHGHLDRLSV